MTTANEATVEKVSRLELVREGKAEDFTPKMPKRGRHVVEIDLVVPDPANERKIFLDIEELARTIKLVGVIEPPTVVPLEDGRYLITTGERRWRAARAAGLNRIPVIIGDTEDERQRRLKSLISNVQRADLGPLELAQALQSMKDDREDITTNRDLAGMIGKSEQWVGGMFKILSLPETIKKKLASAKRQIPYDVAQEIARVNDEEGQSLLLKEALKGATVRAIREMAREMKSNGQEGRKTTQATRKIKITTGWVIIHHAEQDDSLEADMAALQEAMQSLRNGGA